MRVMRDKNGIKQGEVILVDKEKGTMACYSVECCSHKIEEAPSCYGDKCCCNSIPVQ